MWPDVYRNHSSGTKGPASPLAVVVVLAMKSPDVKAMLDHSPITGLPNAALGVGPLDKRLELRLIISFRVCLPLLH